MDKSVLRRKYKEKRTNLNVEQQEEKSLAIANLALQLPVWDYEFYHVFLSIREHKEVDTDYLLHILQGKDKNILLSKSNLRSGDMKHYLLTDNTVIKTNSWNIPEPTGGIEIQTDKIDVVFIPLLAFDVKGNRVGYGKGYYDKFLSSCRKNVIKIGLSFFTPEKEIIETIPTDVPLDYCITPEKVYKF